jgi:hypothetical protein
MKKLLIALLLLSNICFSQNLPNCRVLNLPESCFINSILAYERVVREFENYNIWSNVLAFSFLERVNGRMCEVSHAITVLEWQNQLYFYDINQGSSAVRVNSQTNDYLKSNHRRMAQTIYPNKRITFSAYLKDD